MYSLTAEVELCSRLHQFTRGRLRDAGVPKLQLKLLFLQRASSVLLKPRTSLRIIPHNLHIPDFIGLNIKQWKLWRAKFESLVSHTSGKSKSNLPIFLLFFHSRWEAFALSRQDLLLRKPITYVSTLIKHPCILLILWGAHWVRSVKMYYMRSWMGGWIDILPLMEAECGGGWERGPYARQIDNCVISIDFYSQWTLTVLHHWCVFLLFGLFLTRQWTVFFHFFLEISEK